MLRAPLYSFALLLLVSSACSKYSVRRAALVPHQQPLQRSGQPMGDARLAATVGTPTIGQVTEPTEAEGANAGIVLPRHELTGAFRARVTGNLDLGLVWDHGFDQGSCAVGEGIPNPQNGDLFGYGISMYYAATVDEAFSVGIGADLLLYSIPFVEYRTCVENCGGAEFTIVKDERDTIPVVSVGVIPSWKVKPNVAVFGGATLRNHPTIEKSDVEGPEIFDDEEVEPGPANVVLSGGVELELHPGFRAMVYVHQPTYGNPVNYGPTVGVALTVPLIREKRAPAPLAPGPPPPPPPSWDDY